jgi:hypothetical protein
MTCKPGGGGESGRLELTKEYIITMGRIIKARNMLILPKVDDYEWRRQMDKIHKARKRIRWIICDKRGRFDENRWLVLE